MDPRIEAYIRANRKRYTRDAINQRLLEAGHDRAAIEATWAALDTRDPDAVAGEGFWLRFAAFVVVLNVAALLLVGVVSGMLLGGGGIFVLVILGVALAIGGLIAWAIVAVTHPTEMGRGTAMAVGGLVPLLFTFLIAGSCYALVGGLAGGGPPTIQGNLTLEIEPPLEVSATGTANCFPTGGGGFSVFSGELGDVGGRFVSVSLESFGVPVEDGVPGPAPAPGNETSTSLFINLAPRNENDPPLDYHTGPGATLDVQAREGGLAGSAAFENLTPNVEGADVDAEPISGALEWDCTGQGG
jgi:hypothetical protein